MQWGRRHPSFCCIIAGCSCPTNSQPVILHTFTFLTSSRHSLALILKQLTHNHHPLSIYLSHYSSFLSPQQAVRDRTAPLRLCVLRQQPWQLDVRLEILDHCVIVFLLFVSTEKQGLTIYTNRTNSRPSWPVLRCRSSSAHVPHSAWRRKQPHPLE